MKLRRIGNSAATVLHTSWGELLISYSTPVAARVGERFYRTSAHYSVTTSKHINRFVGEPCESRDPEYFAALMGEEQRHVTA